VILNYGDFMTILQDIKTGVGVGVDNLGFDSEILLHINSVASGLTQLGVTQFGSTEIDSGTEWPVFTNQVTGSLIKHYMVMKVKQTFDPQPSETIAKIFETSLTRVEGRIAHEVSQNEV